MGPFQETTYLPYFCTPFLIFSDACRGRKYFVWPPTNSIRCYELQIVKDLLMWNYGATNHQSAKLIGPFQKPNTYQNSALPLWFSLMHVEGESILYDLPLLIHAAMNCKSSKICWCGAMVWLIKSSSTYQKIWLASEITCCWTNWAAQGHLFFRVSRRPASRGSSLPC